MAVWNFGPYDNDDAVDWCARLEAEMPGSRINLIASTLGLASVPLPRLSMVQCCEIVAAAATVLQLITGRQESASAYGPRFLSPAEGLPANTPLRELAVKALRTVAAKGSAWRDGWADDVEADEALEMIRSLLKSLESTS